MWDAATDLGSINVWFSWASYIKEIDKTPLGLGKRFQVGYRILPIMGDYTFIATVKEFKRGRSVPELQSFMFRKVKYFRLIELEGNNLLKPKLRVVISSSKKNMSRLNLSLVFQRKSALFQLQLGFLLRFIAEQQLSQSLLVLQLLTNNFV